MNFPDFYKPEDISRLYLPRTQLIKEQAFEQKQNIKTSTDEAIAFLLIDFQVDFTLPQGSLYVPGAEKDLKRVIDFIYTNIDKITAFYPTLDTHQNFQIFYSQWWIDNQGEHPPAYTIITHDDVVQGKYRSITEDVWCMNYVKELEKDNQKALCLWPEHTMLGTPGHALVPALFEALYFHSLIFTKQIAFQLKGLWPNSEMYGVFEPEVPLEFLPNNGKNIDLLDELSNFQTILVAGEAKSHCVIESVKQMAAYYKDRPDVLGKIILLEDAMSSVVHPDVDFEAMANKEIAELKNMGIRTAKTSDLIL